MVKDDEEISLMREAVRITEGALRKTLLDLKPGLREYEIAAMLEGSMRFMGADGYAFETIVASGPNGAFPHALPTSKEVVEGEEIVIDMGARFGGYCADMTRTPVLGKADKEIKSIIEALDEAVNEATDAVAPGVKVSDVDAIARKVLAKQGLDKYFIHSLGHGVGVEVHEPPRVAQGVNAVLEPGNVITIEPGVYINGKYGARIENMVLVTKSGHDVINSLPNLV
jgi:Xaa-Pro aminopeptidase